MLREQNADEGHERLKEQKTMEMENRRRAMLKRCENKQRLRQIHIERREAQKSEKVGSINEASELKASQIERTDRLVEEVSHRKPIQFQESLKQKKVKAATQPLSNSALKLIEAKLQKEKECEKIENAKPLEGLWYHAEDTTTKQQYEKRLNYRKELQNQLIDNRRRLLEREEEKHRERKILEEVAETIRREDLEAQKRKEETAILLQTERDAFLKARHFWKDKRRQVLKQEHDQITMIVAEKEAFRKREAEEQTDIRASKDVMVERLAKKMTDEEHKKMEREEICRELYLAEKENDLANEEMKMVLKKKRTARELLQDMVRHQKAVAERKAKEDAIDAAFARYLAKERRASEEKEKQKEQARREKTIRYGNELRETIARNRMQYTNEDVQSQSQNNIKEDDSKTRNVQSGNSKVKCLPETVLEAWKSGEQRSPINA